MEQTYRAATVEDAELLIWILNEAFYEDHVRYGGCPAYGRSLGDMKDSILKTKKEIVYVGDRAVGVISGVNKGEGRYYIGCLCVIPEYQHKGIGNRTLLHFKEEAKDWKEIELITPADKEENVTFYTKKCGFEIKGTEMDGKVKVYRFVMSR